MEKKESSYTLDDYWMQVHSVLLQKAKDMTTMYFDYKGQSRKHELMDKTRETELRRRFSDWQKRLATLRHTPELSIHLSTILARLRQCVETDFPEIQTLRGRDRIETRCLEMNAKNSRSELYSLMLRKQHFLNEIQRIQEELITLS